MEAIFEEPAGQQQPPSSAMISITGRRAMDDLYPELIDRPLVAETYRPLRRAPKSYRATRFSPETFLIAPPAAPIPSRNVADYADKIHFNETPATRSRAPLRLVPDSAIGFLDICRGIGLEKFLSISLPRRASMDP